MTLDSLSKQIEQLDSKLKSAASKSVNILLTARNWMIGFYLVEYEHSGKDRAEYGKALTEKLAKRLNTKGLSARNLWLFRQFYLTYPQIGLTFAQHPRIKLPASTESKFQPLDLKEEAILRSPIAESQKPLSLPSSDILRSLVAEFAQSSIWQKNLTQLPQVHVPGDKLLQKLSYTHFQRLLPLKDPLQRAFYEIEAIKGTWSVRELKRQISSLYYERSGLSKKPELLSEITQEKTDPPTTQKLTKDLYAFEFLGLPSHLAVEESDLETALLDHLHNFLLEFGHGFCFEARQKRILIGDEYFFIDLVLYHRILKCHVLVELKVGAFSHENAGQLNTYLNYFRAEVSQENDNPPIGILLVADKNTPLVEYATVNMDPNLFVREYLLKLPSKEELTSFIQRKIKTL